MRMLLPLMLFLLCSNAGLAQADADSLIIGRRMERLPSFPNGEQALYKYLDRNVRMPEAALAASISGSVYITFLIDSTGALHDPEVKRGLGYGCDEEAVRVVRGMPRWEPGTVLRKPHAVQYILPVRFDGRRRRR
ncbi:MAG: energy transducer TonB [Flavobacteriales bacterium]|nr:energy transducer TonB [Flavobacteriales bacterium]